MSERFCIRGCVVRGEHYAACGRSDDTYLGSDLCAGCVRVDAREGVLICERCFRTLRRHLDDAADVVAHLRAIADPTRATVFDRERVQSSSAEMPAPVSADLIDASNDITTTVNMWANHVAGEDRPGLGLTAGSTSVEAHSIVRFAVEVILDELDSLADDAHQIGALCEGVMVTHGPNPVVWSVADALSRWPLEDSPRWAQVACPECDLMSVRVRPGRNGRPALYQCTAVECEWEADSDDDDGLWGSMFAEPDPPEARPHDPTLLTLNEAACLVRRQPGTLRAWVKAGDIVPHLGRYKRSDVIAVSALKRGGAA